MPNLRRVNRGPVLIVCMNQQVHRTTSPGQHAVHKCCELVQLGQSPHGHSPDSSVDDKTSIPACRSQGQAFGFAKEVYEKRSQVSEVEPEIHSEKVR